MATPDTWSPKANLHSNSYGHWVQEVEVREDKSRETKFCTLIGQFVGVFCAKTCPICLFASVQFSLCYCPKRLTSAVPFSTLGESATLIPVRCLFRMRLCKDKFLSVVVPVCHPTDLNSQFRAGDRRSSGVSVQPIKTFFFSQEFESSPLVHCDTRKRQWQPSTPHLQSSSFVSSDHLGQHRIHIFRRVACDHLTCKTRPVSMKQKENQALF